MRVAVVIPSLNRDESYLRRCLKAVEALDPAPDHVLVNRNDGTLGLQRVREQLFDEAFKVLDCDVALQVSSDFHLFPDILKEVEGNRITTFAFFARKLSMPILALKFFLSPGMFTGCYSLPWNAWIASDLSLDFDGTDTSIKVWAEVVGHQIKRVRVPKYSLMRPTTQMKELVRDLPLKKKILKMVSWF